MYWIASFSVLHSVIGLQTCLRSNSGWGQRLNRSKGSRPVQVCLRGTRIEQSKFCTLFGIGIVHLGHNRVQWRPPTARPQRGEPSSSPSSETQARKNLSPIIRANSLSVVVERFEQLQRFPDVHDKRPRSSGLSRRDARSE